MRLTLNTDGSFKKIGESTFGGGAFWIVSNKGRITKSFPLKNVFNSHDAELQTLGNAFHTLLTLPYLLDIKTIYVNTDSDYCIDILTHKKLPMEALQNTSTAVFGLLNKLRQASPNHKMIFRRLKSHSPNINSRNWVNNWCDEEAKKEQRKLVNQFHRQRNNERKSSP